MKERLLTIIQAYRADTEHLKVQQTLDDLNDFIKSISHHRLLGIAYSILSVVQLRMTTQVTSEEERIKWSILSTESRLLADYYQVIDEAILFTSEVDTSNTTETLVKDMPLSSLAESDSNCLSGTPFVTDSNNNLEDFSKSKKIKNVSASQQKKANVELEHADHAMQMRDYSTAITYYTQALTYRPNYLPAIRGRVLAAVAQDNAIQVKADLDALDKLDHVLAMTLSVKWQIKIGDFADLQQALQPMILRIPKEDCLEIINMLIHARQFSLAYFCCDKMLIKHPNSEEIFKCLETIGLTSMVAKDMLLAHHCFSRLISVERDFSIIALYSLGIIETHQNSYENALHYFRCVQQHPQFQNFDRATQKRSLFGIMLCATKLKRHDLALLSIVALSTQNPAWKGFIASWLLVELDQSKPLLSGVAKQSDAPIRIYITSDIPPSLVDTVGLFIRDEEFTQDLTSFFTQMSEPLLQRLNQENFDWDLMSPRRLNDWIQVSPDLKICGLLVMLLNPSGLKLFIDHPCLVKKIDVLALNLTVRCKDGILRSALTCLMATAEGQALVATVPELYLKIATPSLNQFMPVLGMSVLGVFLATDCGKALLVGDKRLREIINSEGLNQTFLGRFTPLCLLMSDPQMLEMLDSDPKLCEKISLDRLNVSYTNPCSMLSPLYFCAKTMRGREILNKNPILRGKINRQGILDAIAAAQYNQDESTMNWLVNELKRPEYQALVRHHRLLNWFQPATSGFANKATTHKNEITAHKLEETSSLKRR